MWNGFSSEEFTFAGRNATIVFPSCAPNGRLLLKPEYLPAFPRFDAAMLRLGYHLINLTHPTRWASAEETRVTAEFAQYCAEKLRANPRCVLEGMSCGGLQAARFAEEYPAQTAVVYLDNPVLNLLSAAGLGAGREPDTETFFSEIAETYHVDRSTLVNLRESPIDNMPPLIEHRIPVILLYGDADTLIIGAENSRVLEDYYRAHGGTLKVIVRRGAGHHPHGLDDPGPIINFIEQHFPK